MVNVGDTTACSCRLPRHERVPSEQDVHDPHALPDRPGRRRPRPAYCGDRNNANDGYINWQRFPSLKKFQDNLRANLTAQEGGKVQVLFRLGEVYLIAAEADIGLGNTAEAATFINVLHQRAASPATRTTTT